MAETSDRLVQAEQPSSLRPDSPPLAGDCPLSPPLPGLLAASDAASSEFSYRGLTGEEYDDRGFPRSHPFFNVRPDPTGKTDPILARWLELSAPVDRLGGARGLFVPPDACNEGVYLLVRDDRVLYVGQSGNVRKRLNWHRSQRRNPYTREVLFSSALVLPVATGRRSHIETVETALIRFLCPPWNAMDGTNRYGSVGPPDRFDLLLLQALGVGVTLPRRKPSDAPDRATAAENAEILRHARHGGAQ